ncbi:haloacid dehalogenase superfamily, subfamily IA, variant 3 with third motif having DD or ED [Mucilaginibacter mallensis]|uniref:phosphoglycolate phosphatase n=1 Tax=Mucilaginibacter mallensis TaxID=652787 RepID=A0A1H1V5R6_MUCMA|nr:HAD hydrolase-like protein [Mucilaginibacter mallensis]SDS79960.1 haloacid dehalogenase superfamily, subfamily IA, variant 3 with third motif having DD or ED [Mucilaginibacter mallensis]
MKYTDIDKRKTAFIFELDNVLYPEKDYLYQVYYLFANLIEYTELHDAKAVLGLMTSTYENEGKDKVFDHIKERFHLDEKYRASLDNQMLTAKLPLKLLLFKNMLELMQDIVVDRKKIFIVTNGKPEQQLNKIKQTEWHGLEKYLVCYFADETTPKPEPDIVHLLLKEHNLQRRDILMIENAEEDRLCAQACGIDYLNAEQFL